MSSKSSDHLTIRLCFEVSKNLPQVNLFGENPSQANQFEENHPAKAFRTKAQSRKIIWPRLLTQPSGSKNPSQVNQFAEKIAECITVEVHSSAIIQSEVKSFCTCLFPTEEREAKIGK